MRKLIVVYGIAFGVCWLLAMWLGDYTYSTGPEGRPSVVETAGFEERAFISLFVAVLTFVPVAMLFFAASCIWPRRTKTPREKSLA